MSGNATLVGTTLAFTDGNPVVVRATQAGGIDYNPVTRDQTFTAQKLAQTITFTAPADQRGNAAPLSLVATASSGLPVSFSLIGGPAALNGATLAFTGDSGAVVVRASQPGDAKYGAAPDVDRTFNVTAIVPGRLINISGLASAGGNQPFITGFVVGGTTAQPLLMRAVGPGLVPLGVQGVLADPSFNVVHNGAIVALNDNWESGGAGPAPRSSPQTLASGRFRSPPGRPMPPC